MSQLDQNKQSYMGSGTGHQCTAGQVCVVTQCFCSISFPQFLFLPISLRRVHKHTCMDILTLPFSDLPDGSLGRCVSLNNTIRKLLLPQDMNFTPHNPSHSHIHTHTCTHTYFATHSLCQFQMLTMLVVLYFSKKQQTFTHLNTSSNNIIFRCAITSYYSGAVLGAWPLWLMYLLITAATLISLICSWSEILPCLFQSLLSLTIIFSSYGKIFTMQCFRYTGRHGLQVKN